MPQLNNTAHNNPIILTIVKAKKIDDIVAKFIINNLPKISGDLGYKYIKEMVQEIYINALTLEKFLAGRKMFTSA